ncbi:MAG: hypothetical protein DRN12_03125 [Thermoplasmata archaeon]|nr:MAG: hypothetical protein DRN12_03125 [Thermoplasmata archaeon]
MEVFHKDFIEGLEEIIDLSKKVNGEDRDKIFSMIHEHIEEIHELYSKGDKHWAVETGDLIILCLELLLFEDKDIDGILSKCISRFKTKLVSLLSE